MFRDYFKLLLHKIRQSALPLSRHEWFSCKGKEVKDSLLRVCVVVKTSKMQISRRTLADYAKLHWKACDTCSKIVFLHSSNHTIDLWRYRQSQYDWLKWRKNNRTARATPAASTLESKNTFTQVQTIFCTDEFCTWTTWLHGANANSLTDHNGDYVSPCKFWDQWIDEEIHLLLHVVLDYKVGKAGKGVGKETVYHDFADWFCVKFDFKQLKRNALYEGNKLRLATFLLSKQR